MTDAILDPSHENKSNLPQKKNINDFLILKVAAIYGEGNLRLISISAVGRLTSQLDGFL